MENVLLILGSLLVLSGMILTQSRSTLVRPLVAHLRLFGLALSCAVFLLDSAPLFSQAPPGVETEAEPETDKAIIEQIHIPRFWLLGSARPCLRARWRRPMRLS